uniref:Uncharacterized protein n=1 Tax=Plectus sambesii TaxID=2011161 RepID=A0A914W1R8_9BILA
MVVIGVADVAVVVVGSDDDDGVVEAELLSVGSGAVVVVIVCDVVIVDDDDDDDDNDVDDGVVEGVLLSVDIGAVVITVVCEVVVDDVAALSLTLVGARVDVLDVNAGVVAEGLVEGVIVVPAAVVAFVPCGNTTKHSSQYEQKWIDGCGECELHNLIHGRE